MEGFEKFDLEKPEDVRHLLPSGFLRTLDNVEDLWKLDEVDLMVRVVAAEAEREGREGKEGVAHVIMNRLKHPNLKRFHGYDIKSVILKPEQFKSIKHLKHKILNPQKYFSKRELEEAIDAVGEVYFGGKEDNTGGADHFHHKREVPSWGPSMDVTARIGNHVFRKSR